MNLMRKISISMVLLAIVLTSIAPIKVNAATVGDLLKTPESGWQRYDDSHSNILYEGNWTTQNNSTNYLFYKGSNKYTNDGTGKIKFVFKGSKLRYIGRIWEDTYFEPITIMIDGVEKGQFYQKGITSSSQRLNFEITDLEDSVHTVEISSTGKYAIDAIDIDSTGTILGYYAPTNLIAIAGDSKIDITWSPVTNVTNYNIKRSTTPYGPYAIIATTSANTYIDTSVKNGTTYYYVISSVVSGVESVDSNEVFATPTAIEVPSANSAKIILTMTNGNVKEYDLTSNELKSFLTWFDNRSGGNDKAYYIFLKKTDTKPFLIRKEYITYNKISSFEVNEYIE